MQVTLDVPPAVASMFERNPKIGVNTLAKQSSITNYEARIWWFALKNGKVSHLDETYQDRIKKYFDEKSGTLEINSLTISTLDEALAVADVDLEKYEVERHIINSWGVTMKGPDGEPEYRTNYQVKVWLKPRVILPMEEAIHRLIERLPKHKPKYGKMGEKPDGNYMLEVSLHDAHWGLLAWAAETGTDDDLKIKEQIYLTCINDLIKMSYGFDPSLFVLPIGSDFGHINSPDNKTPQHGYPLDVDSRLPKIYQTAKLAVFKAIDFMIGIAPVEVPFVPGNHDPEFSYFLCDAIREHYSTTDRVTVDISPKSRKYKRWGAGLLGLTHGNEEPHRDLPALMAAECSEWGKTFYREWHVGHQHKKKQMFYNAGDTYGGVIVRTLPSLSGTDSWHYKKGYIKTHRAGEAYLWDKKRGCVGYFTANYPN